MIAPAGPWDISGPVPSAPRTNITASPSIETASASGQIAGVRARPMGTILALSITDCIDAFAEPNSFEYVRD
jgi:hypothetical protein